MPAQEMRIIAEFLQIQVGDVEGGIDATMIDARLKRFKDAADLLTVARLLPAMAEALHVLVPEADFSALRHLSDATTEVIVRAMNLSKVSEQLDRVKLVTTGMEPFHVELLAGLRDKSEVIAFLKAEAVDFKPRLALIQQNLQVGRQHIALRLKACVCVCVLIEERGNVPGTLMICLLLHVCPPFSGRIWTHFTAFTVVVFFVFVCVCANRASHDECEHHFY